MNSTPAAIPVRQTVKKLKKSFENCLNDDHSPIGVLDNNKNGLVFSRTLVARNPKTKFHFPESYKAFRAKTLPTKRTLQHICEVHKIHRTKANLAKDLQLPKHWKQSFNLRGQSPTLKRKRRK